MKLLLRLAVILFVLGLLGVAAVAMLAGKGAKVAVERGGTYALGVETTLDKANLGLFSGEFGLTGLDVANPEGFEEPSFFSLTGARMDMSLKSVFSDTIVVKELVIDGFELDLERIGGKTNYGAILEHLERFESGATAEPSDEGGKKFLIEHILIRNVDAKVKLSVAGQKTTIPVKLPEIELHNVGTGEGGQTVAGLFSLVLEKVLNEVLKAGKDLLPADLLQDLGGQLKNLGSELTSGLGAAAKEFGQEALGGSGGDLKQLGADAEEALKEAGKDLKGLLEKKD